MQPIKIIKNDNLEDEDDIFYVYDEEIDKEVVKWLDSITNEENNVNGDTYQS